MTMLIIEINDPNKNSEQPAPKNAVQQEPKLKVQTPVQEEIPYAEKRHYDFVEQLLEPDLEKLDITTGYYKGAGRLPHLRFTNVNPAEFDKIVKPLGFKPLALTDKQAITSGQFSIQSYERMGIVYTFVLRGVKTAQAHVAAGASQDLVLNRKDLTPTKLGLSGKKFNSKSALVDELKKSLKIKLGRNPNLLSACNQYVDIANAGGTGKLDAKTLAYITPVLGMIGQDLGELLAPLVLAGDKDVIEFPSGNEKLIDVQIGKIRYSVKALGGSGTSMNSLGNLLDEYEMTLSEEGKKQMFQNALKIWKSTRKEGSVTDRICLAGKINQSPEYLGYTKILGGDFDSFAKLKTLLSKKTAKLSYDKFLKLVYPIMSIGNWGTPVGLPDDGAYTLGLTKNKPKPGVAGKPSYDADPVDGGANIITYSIGIGLRNMIERGPNAAQYKEILTDMLRTMDVRLGHVTLSQDGGLIVKQKPFAELEFKFDYHAPSHIAGNNRPGFVVVPPK